VRPPSVERLRCHPELVVLIGLSSQLELLPTVLGSVHEAEDRRALADQARAMAKVSQVLAAQMRAYIGMVESDVGGKKRK
jgi:hypothetical protein